MIGRITGKVLEKGPTHVLVDVGGVGYEIDIPLSTYSAIANVEDVSLHTHLIVREDGQQLFGFFTASERELFRALIKVNRVGPRLALTVLSGMEPTQLAECVRNDDINALAGVPGVGKKTAERMILDLRDRLPELAPQPGESGTATIHQLPGSNLADAESALIGLGFRPQQAAMALARVEDQEADVEVLIREALKALS